MGNFKPAPFPRRPRHSNVASELHYLYKKLYYQYEINTGQYVMSPGEKTAYNLVVMILLTFLGLAFFYYVPDTVFSGLHRLVYYITGVYRLDMGPTGVKIAPEFFQVGGFEAAASLTGSAVANNATMRYLVA